MNTYNKEIEEQVNYFISLYNLDAEKTKEELERKLVGVDFEKIYNKRNYIAKVFSGLNLNKLKKIEKNIDLSDMAVTMKRLGFTGSPADLLYLEYIEAHALNEFPSVTADALTILNRQVVNYVNEHAKTYEQVIYCVLHSKLFSKVAIPTAILKEKAYKEHAEIREALKKLNERTR